MFRMIGDAGREQEGLVTSRRTPALGWGGKVTALLLAAALLVGVALSGARTSAAAPPQATARAAAVTGLRASLRAELEAYLERRRTPEHISAVSLRVTFPGVVPSTWPWAPPGSTRDAPSRCRASGRSAATPRRSRPSSSQEGGGGQAVDRRHPRRVAAPISGMGPDNHQAAAEHDERHPGLPRHRRVPARVCRRAGHRLLGARAGVVRRWPASAGLALHEHRLHPRADDHRESKRRYVCGAAAEVDHRPARLAEHLLLS